MAIRLTVKLNGAAAAVCDLRGETYLNARGAFDLRAA
jgi:hypothetical protein